MKRTLSIGFTLLAALLMTACSTPGSNPNIRHNAQNTINAEHPRMRLVLGSKKLVGKIALVDVRMGSVGNFARAEVTVQNLSNNRYALEYVYDWEDEQGFSINENKVWKRFVLAPREVKSFQTIGKDPRAYQATMKVRLPEDVFIQQEKLLEKEN